jgi:hypothetical protein
MKKILYVFLVAFSLFIISTGCSSVYYSVITNDGKEMITTKEPEFDKKSQSYEFTDVKGNKWILKREDIKSIEEKRKGT